MRLHIISIKTLLLSLLIIFAADISIGQKTYTYPSTKLQKASFQNKKFHRVKKFKQPDTKGKPKNVILLIGDGMGYSQLYAAMTANMGELFIQNCKYTGIVKTHSSDDYVTDSGAAGTALATGEKSYNGAIGVNNKKEPIKNIREMAEEKGLATGLVATSAITHATPASFVAHQPSRKMYEEIASEFYRSGIEIFIGGGWDHFEKREDKANYSDSLRSEGYDVLYNIYDIEDSKADKIAVLTAPEHNPPLPERGDLLVPAIKAAIETLAKEEKGFFLMAEGSQIDWGAHANETAYTVMETLEFDRAAGEALRFAEKNGETLVIITSDHETGGMSLNNGDISKGKIESLYTTGDHTGMPVPVFAFGPGAENFTGIFDNTDIPKMIIKLLEL